MMFSEEDGYFGAEPSTHVLVDGSGMRTVLTVALRKDELLLGALTVYRQEIRPFSDQQITLFADSCRMTARIACGCPPLRSATPASSERPVTAILMPSMMTSLILYPPLYAVRRQSTLIGWTPWPRPDPRMISLETIAPSGSGRLPVTLAPPSLSYSDNRSLYRCARRNSRTAPGTPAAPTG